MSLRDRKVNFVTFTVALVVIPVQFLMGNNAEDLDFTDLTDSEEVTDECILNLFVISDMLQEGVLPPADFTCPAGDDPYIISRVGGDIVVSDPNPELHGYRKMSVSKNNPMPQLID